MNEEAKQFLYEQLKQMEQLNENKENIVVQKDFFTMPDSKILEYLFQYRDRANFGTYPNGVPKQAYIELPDMNLEGQDLSNVYLSDFIPGKVNLDHTYIIPSKINLSNTHANINLCRIKPNSGRYDKLALDLENINFSGCHLYTRLPDEYPGQEFLENFTNALLSDKNIIGLRGIGKLDSINFNDYDITGLDSDSFDKFWRFIEHYSSKGKNIEIDKALELYAISLIYQNKTIPEIFKQCCIYEKFKKIFMDKALEAHQLEYLANHYKNLDNKSYLVIHFIENLEKRDSFLKTFLNKEINRTSFEQNMKQKILTSTNITNQKDELKLVQNFTEKELNVAKKHFREVDNTNTNKLTRSINQNPNTEQILFELRKITTNENYSKVLNVLLNSHNPSYIKLVLDYVSSAKVQNICIDLLIKYKKWDYVRDSYPKITNTDIREKILAEAVKKQDFKFLKENFDAVKDKNSFLLKLIKIGDTTFVKEHYDSKNGSEEILLELLKRKETNFVKQHCIELKENGRILLKLIDKNEIRFVKKHYQENKHSVEILTKLLQRNEKIFVQEKFETMKRKDYFLYTLIGIKQIKFVKDNFEAAEDKDILLNYMLEQISKQCIGRNEYSFVKEHFDSIENKDAFLRYASSIGDLEFMQEHLEDFTPAQQKKIQTMIKKEHIEKIDLPLIQSYLDSNIPLTDKQLKTILKSSKKHLTQFGSVNLMIEEIKQKKKIFDALKMTEDVFTNSNNFDLIFEDKELLYAKIKFLYERNYPITISILKQESSSFLYKFRKELKQSNSLPLGDAIHQFKKQYPYPSTEEEMKDELESFTNYFNISQNQNGMRVLEFLEQSKKFSHELAIEFTTRLIDAEEQIQKRTKINSEDKGEKLLDPLRLYKKFQILEAINCKEAAIYNPRSIIIFSNSPEMLYAKYKFFEENDIHVNEKNINDTLGCTPSILLKKYPKLAKSIFSKQEIESQEIDYPSFEEKLVAKYKMPTNDNLLLTSLQNKENTTIH